MSGRHDRARAALLADRAAALKLVDVSRETLERLDHFVENLLRWQRTINLVAPSTVERIWTRHIADSFQLLAHAPDALFWVDLGSGGGFPGLVLACGLTGTPAQVHLVESDSRKAAFLRETANALGVPAVVHNRRIEVFSADFRDPVDVVTARALAPLTKLIRHAAPFVERGAQTLFLKGQDVEAELTEAARCWHIEFEFLPSATDSRGRIIRLRQVRPRQVGPNAIDSLSKQYR